MTFASIPGKISHVSSVDNMPSKQVMLTVTVVSVAGVAGFALSPAKKMSTRLFHSLICAFVTLAVVTVLNSRRPKNTLLQDRIRPDRIVRRLRDSPQFAPAKMSPAQMYRMAQMWRLGSNGIGVDIDRALFFYNQALEGGVTEAYVDLGLLHQDLRRDALTSIECFVSAIENGHLQAVYYLGKLYENGLWPHYLPSKITAMQLYELCITHSTGGVREDAMIKLADMRTEWQGTWGPVNTTEDALPWSRPLPLDIIQRVVPLLPEPIDVTEPPPPQTVLRAPPVRADEYVWQIPFFDVLNIDAVIGDAIFAGPDHHQVGYGDSQNVHDTAVLGETRAALNKLRDNQQQQSTATPSNKIAQVRDMIRNSGAVDGEGRQRAERVLNTLTNEVHSKLGLSERQVLETVYDRMHDPVNVDNKQNLEDMLVQNLADAVENGTTVCSTGRAVRIASTLDAIDAENVLSIRPAWAIKEEIENTASAIREAVLNDKTAAERAAFEKADPEEEEQRMANEVAEDIKKKLVEKCQKDYVEPGILSAEGLDARLKPYLDAIV